MQILKFAASKLTNYDKASQWKPEMGSLYSLHAKDIDGNDYDFNQLRGKVSLVCNVASECGYTGCGYKFLEEEQTKYEKRNFTVLGFPCNQFGKQEPGEAKDIKDKADVNGPNTQPVFAYLKQVYPGDVTWNFHGMFLINEEGIPIKRIQHQKYPEIDANIKQALDDRDAKVKQQQQQSSTTEQAQEQQSQAAATTATTSTETANH